ncbi:hypothetical protein [Streptomyces sp. NPDC093225]|uniref:hypothetical protein n=1 Tax=Streptomyces sp. NPDC093225 TaxID=3366034 RepID=UPI00381F2E69
MHPTRTTTKLLLGVAAAVSAVSGCVNVNPDALRPAATAVPPEQQAEDPRYEPRGGPGDAPVVVRAPALEALEAAPAEERAAPSSGAGAAADAKPADGAVAAARRPGTRPGSRAEPEPGPAPVEAPADELEPPAAAAPGRGHAKEPKHPHAGGRGRPEAAPPVPLRPADVCAVGRRFGQWKKDGPESRICSDVYGE